MTKRQKAAARKILANDCQLACQYIKGSKTCAIGALALRAGVTKKELIAAGSIRIYSLYEIMDKIRDVFGLSGEQLDEIQICNDFEVVAQERRKGVLERLDSFATS